MYRFARAATYAAASLFLVAAVDATPSKAWELSSAPGATSRIEGAAGLAEPAPGAPPPAAEAPPGLEADEPRAEPQEIRLSLSELVALHAATTARDAQHECLAGAVYFEAKGESLEGQLTVAEVVLNRARSGRFPASICGVVKQRGQFSFIRAGRFPAIARQSMAWRRAVAIAHIAQAALADGAAPKALFFHARYVRPGWKLRRIAAVGNHIFYR
jgi:spore germination cell wall hydrolase CwlJ-like protein